MTKNLISNKNLWRHLMIWALVTTYLCLLDPVEGDIKTQVIVTFFIMLCYVFVFYSIGLFVFPEFWPSKLIFFVLSMAGVFLIFTGIVYLNFNYIYPSLGGTNFYNGVPIGQIPLHTLMPFTLAAIPGIAYFLSNISLARMKLQSDREKVILANELNFLKNQFNSHITFNFLNYCYSNVHEISEKTAEAIAIFSNMLRYSLEIRSDEKVPVTKEVEYISNFIALQKLLTTKLFVDFKVDGEINNKVILPRLLVTFIENAFKHGQINSPESPIKIHLYGNDELLNLRVANRKNLKKNIRNTGVGHENVLHTLKLYYSDKYNLVINEDSQNYVCDLKLQLK